MKEVVYTKQALLQFEESVKELVEQGYFGEEDYAIMYMRDIFRYFALNLQNSVSVAAPEYFNRYCVDGKTFYEELENVYSIVYLANNKLIGHLLDISL